MVWVLDSNFFIEAHRKSNPLDVSLSFWNKVKQLAENGAIISIDKVRDELYNNQDVLSEWCKDNLPTTFFHDTSSIIGSQYASVAQWAALHPQYNENAKNVFLDVENADAFLVAFAMEAPTERIIVTQEVPAPLAQSSIKLPDICTHFRLQCTDMYNAFRQMNVTF